MLINLQNTNDFTKILSENKKVLVDFYATWCGPCRMLGPVLEELDDENTGVTILKINVDDHQALAAQFGIYSIPTMIVFEDNKKVKTLQGYMPKEALLSELQ